jgi:hypothetical protein
MYKYILGDSIIDQNEAISVENLPQFQPLRTATSILPLIRKETLPDQLQHYRQVFRLFYRWAVLLYL